MKLHCFLFFWLLLSLLACNPKSQTGDSFNEFGIAHFYAPENNSRMRLFDLGWHFAKTDDSLALVPDFDDSNWRQLDLPHDWSIENLPEGDGVIGPFSKSSPGRISTGFTIGGTGMYRKTFVVDEEDRYKIFTIYFDGVYMESDVWLNGHHLGFFPNGYMAFHYELTPYLNKPGVENTLVVRAKNIGENSRWYSGSGIYRHVWLRVTEPVNIPVWGVFVTTPNVSESSATVSAEIKIQNQSKAGVEVKIQNRIIDTKGRVVSKSITDTMQIAAGSEIGCTQLIDVDKPLLWSTETPNLYTLETEILVNGKLADKEATSFGIRSIEFTPEKGFLLNGKPVFLHGGCVHHDNGILGAATFNRAEQRRVELLKANGFNAIRASHNPPSRQFVEACDRLGVLLINEAFDMWQKPKRPNDYHRFFDQWAVHDIQAMVLRDRNSPSVIMWSYGNEIRERADSSGLEIAKMLIAAVKELDTTRPVTQAICDFWETAYDRDWSQTAPAFELMDVHSYNYRYGDYETDHVLYPERIMLGSESFPDKAYENYRQVLEKPYVIGDFVWTAMDYLGEAGIGQAWPDKVTMDYPWFNAYCGDIDLLGNKKPQSYYRDVVWGSSQLEMFVEQPAPKGSQWAISAWGWRNERQSWNWPGHENEMMNVYVYSSAKTIVMELNGEKIAEKNADGKENIIFRFEVPYKPGELKAIALNDGIELARKCLITTDEAFNIDLKPDREKITANRNDLVFIEVNLLDKDYLLVLHLDQMIHFSLAGEAEIIAVGNGNPAEMKSFQADSCKTFMGKCMVVLRPTGKSSEVMLDASADGLLSKSIRIKLK
jgi:beta-galactosidase